MATKHYENGIVGTTEDGDALITSDIHVTGAVYWVNSTGGNDANAGTNRNLPKATLASALTAATANNGDIIILEEGHAETSAVSIALNEAGITILGLGAGSTKPAFTVNGNVDLLAITGARVKLFNLRFPAGTAAHTARIDVAAAGCFIKNCDFTCGANDLLSITVPDGGDDLRVEGCTFTISADGPDCGIKVESATTLGLKVIECTFDGGSYDFDDAGLYSSVAHTEYLYQDNTLTNKASIIHTAASKGLCSGTIAGDGSRVEV